MATTLLEPLTTDAPFRLREADRVLTPALLIDRDRVEHNIATTLRLLGGDSNRWRPHVKTAKLGYVMRMLVDAGVRQFKCATGLELSVACEAGARDVLVAYPLIGANAARVRQIAERQQSVDVSVLVENLSHVEQWRGTPVSLFVDVNPGMNRTGIPDQQIDTIVALCRQIASSKLRFRGLHYYDGHLSHYALAERCAPAHRGYDRLLAIVEQLAHSGIEPDEVITAGTPAFPCSLSFARFSGAQFAHRVSPGTVVYCDATALRQLPPEYGYVPAAVVMTRVVSHPAPGIITCDAGHKTVSADAGVPTCTVLGHPEFEALSPSEEHLPMKVAPGNQMPAIGDALYLVPRHVCPTVNNFDDAVIVSGAKLLGIEPVSARGRERPL
jgi:D-serine deaminase-like pyridoxal phosphate-dependent protein